MIKTTCTPFILMCLSTLSLPFLLVGCGPSTADVNGAVVYKGKPLPAGTVIFFGEDGRVQRASLSSKGIFTMAGAPTGKVKVAIQVPPPVPQQKGNGKGGNEEKESKPSDYVNPIPIPPMYGDPSTSKLEFTIEAGNQDLAISLK